MATVLVSRSSGPGLSPDWDHYVECLSPVSTQVYKWVQANFNSGGNPAKD